MRSFLLALLLWGLTASCATGVASDAHVTVKLEGGAHMHTHVHYVGCPAGGTENDEDKDREIAALKKKLRAAKARLKTTEAMLKAHTSTSAQPNAADTWAEMQRMEDGQR